MNDADQQSECVIDNNLASLEELLRTDGAAQELDSRGRTALHWAAQEDNIQAARILLSYGSNPNICDSDGLTPLAIAVGENRKTIVIALLQNGASPETIIEPYEGGTVLHLAASWGNLSLCRVLLESNRIGLLRIRDYLGRTPVDLARESGNAKLIAYLETQMRKPVESP